MTVLVNRITSVIYNHIKKYKSIKRVIALTLVTVAVLGLSLGLFPIQTYAGAYAYTENESVSVDGGSKYTVRGFDCDYGNNTYVSVRDLAVAFSGSNKSFDIAVGDEIRITTGTGYGAVGGENVPWSEEQLEQNTTDAPSMHKINLNGDTVKYGAFTHKNSDGKADAFMSAVDIAMILDVKISLGEDGCILYDTSSKFAVDPKALENEGFFFGVNGLIVGDATTGEVYFGCEEKKVVPIASTSKLMTYAVVMDAVSERKISLDDVVTIDKEVEELAATPDGVVKYKEGDEITVDELLKCVLLPSSNESALALAKHVAGSEKAFVELMNRRAADIGITDAIFYNCNGLPVYTNSVAPAKCQNRMSAEDMFLLTQYIFKIHPQVTEITSLKKADIEAIHMKLDNTNALLFNMPEVTGLKTGTTTKSGACLVTSLEMQGADGKHDLVVVVFGAESSIDRVRVSEILARYAKNEFLLRNGLDGAVSSENNSLTESGGIAEAPESPEMFIEILINRLRNNN